MEVLQLDFPNPDPIGARTRRTDPISSLAGARRVNADAQRGRILAAMRAARKPVCASAIAQSTGIPTGQVNSRLCVMEKRGMVHRLPDLGVNEWGDPVLEWEPVL